MLVYTPAELKAIAGQMWKGTITDEVYLVLWNRTILRKTPRGRKKQHRMAATAKPPTTDNFFSPLQNTAGTEQLSTSYDTNSPLQHTNKRNTVKQQLNIDYFNCRSVTMKKASEIVQRLGNHCVCLQRLGSSRTKMMWLQEAWNQRDIS